MLNILKSHFQIALNDGNEIFSKCHFDINNININDYAYDTLPRQAFDNKGEPSGGGGGKCPPLFKKKYQECGKSHIFGVTSPDLPTSVECCRVAT